MNLIMALSGMGIVLIVVGLWLANLYVPVEFRAWKDVLEAASYLMILFGLPLGLLQYVRATRKEQLDREYGTYNALDEKFIAYQLLCLERPDLDIFDIQHETIRGGAAEGGKQEVIAFTILFAIFERAYLMYHDQSSELKQRQWTGWDEYIRSFCARDNFRRAWELSGSTYDKDFENYMISNLTAAGNGVRA